MKTTNNSQDGEQNERENGDPVRMWPALINLINSNASYWRAQAQRVNDPHPEKIRFWTMWAALGTCVGAIFALIAAIAILKQFGAMVDDANARDAAFQLDERPWLGIENVASFNFRAGPNFFVPFNFFNPGKTPAVHVVVKTSLKILNKDEAFTPTYPAHPCIKSSVAVVQPQMRVGIGPCSAIPVEISALEYADVEEGRSIVYAYGKITYDDIFPGADERPHETIFCFMYWAGLPGMMQCDVYNGAT